MDKARFETLLETYGADPKRWPEAERVAAEAFASAAGDRVRNEAALDRALDLDSSAVDLDRFAAQAMATFPAANVHALPRRRVSGASPIWALAACALLGVALGFGAGRSAPTDAADQTLVAAFGAFLDTGEGGDG